MKVNLTDRSIANIREAIQKEIFVSEKIFIDKVEFESSSFNKSGVSSAVRYLWLIGDRWIEKKADRLKYKHLLGEMEQLLL